MATTPRERPVYDVRDTAWIPVTYLDGTTATVGLRTLLKHAHTIASLDVIPAPVEAAVLRLSYLIAARTTGLDVDRNIDEWHDQRHDLARHGQFDPQAVDTYLNQHLNRWDLFHPERPWLQDPRLADQSKPVLLNKLDPTRPGGNSLIWDVHTHAGHAPPIPTRQAVLWLLYHHNYGFGSAGGYRSVGNVSKQYMKAGTLRGCMTYYPLGRTLFETLVAGIPTPDSDTGGPVDTAPWEQDQLDDPTDTPPTVTTPGRLLAGQSRHALLLQPDDTGQHVTTCWLTWAFDDAVDDVPDPYTIRVKTTRTITGNDTDDTTTEETWSPRAADRHRAAWRDIDALLANTEHHRRPAILDHVAALPRDLQHHLRVRALGVDQDKQATDYAWVSAITPPIMPWLHEHEPDAARHAEQLHLAAETVATDTTRHLAAAYKQATGRRDCPWKHPVAERFWPQAETEFWRRMRNRDFTEPRRAYTRIALDAIDDVTQQQQRTPAVARAITTVHQKLTNAAAKAEPRKGA